MKQTECSETSANKIQTPRNHTKERTQHSEHGETLISRNTDSCCTFTPNLFSTVITIHYSPYILPYVWKSIIHTKHGNLNWEWKVWEFWLYSSSDVSFTGLFHRSISQSGTATSPWAVSPKGSPKVLAERVAGLFHCPSHPSKDLISCLTKQDAYKLYNAARAIEVSCHIHTKNVKKLKNHMTSNYHVEHSTSGSTS